jgi:hypothetical protein
MRITPTLVVLVSALLGQTPTLTAQVTVDRELMVREVFLPKTGAWESVWGTPLFLADPEASQSTALFTVESIRGPGFTQGNPILPCRVFTGSSRRISDGLDANSVRVWGNYSDQPRIALLGSPMGVEFVGMDFANGPDLKVWDLQTGAFLRWIPHPPPPLGKPALLGFEFIQNAGDVNNDGWDDLFFQDWTLSGNGVAGCLDGQTGQALWMDYDVDYDIASRVLPLQPGPPKDLNGDGIGDFIAGIETARFFQFGHRITAYSGVDGSILWRKDLARSYLRRFSVLCPDLDGDQIDDLISLDSPQFYSGNNGEIMAISGASGAEIWSRDCTFIQSMFPNASRWGLGAPLYVTPNPTGSGNELIVHGLTEYSSGLAENVILVLEADSGTPLSSIDFPLTLAPWHSRTVPARLVPIIQAGDYDGDGNQEIATIVYLDAEDTNSTLIIPGALVILGQRTLFGLAKPRIGQTTDFNVALPAHPNALFQLAFSATFSPRTDPKMWKPQAWPTMLGMGGLVTRTSSHPGLQGQLDSNGQGSVSVRIPSNSAYVGREIFARALITDSINPSEIVTQTSLHSMVIQP